MKRVSSKIYIGMMCVLLGFMISYQIKTIDKQSSVVVAGTTNTPEIINENEQIRKSKEDLQNKIDVINAKIETIENAVVSNGQSRLLSKELEETTLLTEQTNVVGQGMIIYIDHKDDIFGSSTQQIPSSLDLVNIVNQLNYAGAEAISINDIRLTSLSGIRSDGTEIIINGEKIPYNKRITIKVIGNNTILKSTLNFQGSIPQEVIENCNISMVKSDKVEIYKTNKIYTFKFAKPFASN